MIIKYKEKNINDKILKNLGVKDWRQKRSLLRLSTSDYLTLYRATHFILAFPEELHWFSIEC